MPEITVIMPVYNGGDFLAEAVASLQAQTFGDWELIMADDGSTDGAVERATAVGDRRLRSVRHAAQRGVAQALQSACAAAGGRYLAVLEQDDLAHPRRLELQRAFLELQSEVLLLGCASDVIGRDGQFLRREPLVGRHEDILAMTAYVHVLRHSGVMFRRELIERVPYRDLAAADFDLFARAAEAGRTACFPAALCRYRWHGGNFSVCHAAELEAAGGLARMLTRRRRTGRSEDFSEWRRRFVATAADGRAAEHTVHLRCARLFFDEGHDDLAALHAWLAWRRGGGLAAGFRYLRAAARGLGRGRAMRWPLIRAWLKEPAHQLLRAGGMPDRMQF